MVKLMRVRRLPPHHHFYGCVAYHTNNDKRQTDIKLDVRAEETPVGKSHDETSRLPQTVVGESGLRGAGPKLAVES